MNKEETKHLFIELTNKEELQTNGGESVWYWIAYATGATIRGIGEAITAHGQSVIENNGAAGSLAFK